MTMRPDLILRGSFDATHERRYAHVPFEVPHGLRAMHIAYEYTDRIPSDPRLRDGNTLDIGIFDARGIAASSPGFRGWSGSNKQDFTIAENWATPPYLAGPILPGTWHVLLGPYKVGPRGCDYEVGITFSQDAGLDSPRPVNVSASQPRLSSAAEPGWLRGDLHCHTLHSDGDSWPAEMLSEAVSRGLDFLGTTDHNQTSHHADYAHVQGANLPILLPGIEVTTYGGHWNAWGTDTWWEFREPTEVATSRAMQAAAASGALVSVNHPKPFGPAWEYPHAVGYHAIEVWNGDWQRHNDVAMAWWEQQLQARRRIVALGGSDTHFLKGPDFDTRHGRHLGLPTTWACAGNDRSTAGVLAALRAGQVFISRHLDGPQLYLTHQSADFHVRVVDAHRATLMLLSARGVEATVSVGSSDWSDTVRLENPSVYVRAQLLDANEQMLALSNPLF
jgi:hypothetical protein